MSVARGLKLGSTTCYDEVIILHHLEPQFPGWKTKSSYQGVGTVEGDTVHMSSVLTVTSSFFSLGCGCRCRGTGLGEGAGWVGFGHHLCSLHSRGLEPARGPWVAGLMRLSLCFPPRTPWGPAPQRQDGEAAPGGSLPLREDEFRGLHRPPEILCHHLLHSLW